MTFGDARMPERFWRKVAPEPNSGCWLWTAGLVGGGYGCFRVGKTMKNAHRVCYQALVASLPLELQLDHKCRTRCCVNPDHLEPVSLQENVRRGRTGEFNRRKTHCKRGHEYTDANTRRVGTARHCRACNSLAARRYKEKRERQSIQHPRDL